MSPLSSGMQLEGAGGVQISHPIVSGCLLGMHAHYTITEPACRRALVTRSDCLSLIGRSLTMGVMIERTPLMICMISWRSASAILIAVLACVVICACPKVTCSPAVCS